MDLLEWSQKIQDFCQQRDWDPFHSPKNLAIGVVTEASELLEPFRFLTDQESLELLQNEKKRQEISHELADVLFFIIRFADRTGISLEEALRQKMKLNAEKYPIEKAKGRREKYTEL